MIFFFLKSKYLRCSGPYLSRVYCYVRGYIPKFFAFKKPYPLNPEESGLFYLLLIRTKRPKSPNFQREVSSSSELHAIQRIPRDTTTLAFLLILCQKSKTVGTLCRDFLMPLLSDFWPSIKKKARVVVSLGMRFMVWSSDDDENAL